MRPPSDQTGGLEMEAACRLPDAG